MKLQDYIKQQKKRAPKAWAKAERRWDMKMIGPTTDFIFHIADHIYAKAPKGKALYNGPEIEAELWKLLEKVRRITLAESRNNKRNKL